MNRDAFGKVAVLLGGRSAEREISLKSGAAVLAALKRRGVDAHAFDPLERPIAELVTEKFDRAFIMLHGRFGEDGTVQGALELLGIPYTGSGVMASALAMDKWRSKLIWKAAGIPTPKYARLDEGAKGADVEKLIKGLRPPFMVKPAREGSSLGMSKVRRTQELEKACRLARKYDALILVEEFIEGQEFTASILGTEVLPLIRLETPRVFYDYRAKYFSNTTKYHCPCGLSKKKENAIQKLARDAFELLGCRGWGRVDLMLDRKGRSYFLEVNTVPGMTDHSLVPMSARAAGLSFEDLSLSILEQAHAHRPA